MSRSLMPWSSNCLGFSGFSGALDVAEELALATEGTDSQSLSFQFLRKGTGMQRSAKYLARCEGVQKPPM